MKIKPVLSYVIELDSEEGERLCQYLYQANETALLNANPEARNTARQFLSMLEQASRTYSEPPF